MRVESALLDGLDAPRRDARERACYAGWVLIWCAALALAEGATVAVHCWALRIYRIWWMVAPPRTHTQAHRRTRSSSSSRPRAKAKGKYQPSAVHHS